MEKHKVTVILTQTSLGDSYVATFPAFPAWATQGETVRPTWLCVVMVPLLGLWVTLGLAARHVREAQRTQRVRALLPPIAGGGTLW